MSSKFLCGALRGAAWWLLAASAALLLGAAPGAAQSTLPFWRVARLSGDALACLAGAREEAVELIACRERCAPIPWQLDERDADGELALSNGPEPNPDEPSGVVDANDEILWMADDAGRRIAPGEVPAAASCALEIELRGGGASAWVYAFTVPGPARRSPLRYVEYDAGRDEIANARVAIGFGAPTPRYLSLRGAGGLPGPNLLDRLKVRASARFFGLIPLGRDEDDIQWVFGAWHAGPIRIVRREWQWVRLGWGLRTPIFRTESVVYRDSVELPVRLRLNFPPAYFFRGIEVQAALDFRDLRGWTVRTSAGASGVVGALDPAAVARLTAPDAEWLALEGPSVTVVLRLQLSDSFASLRRQLLYRDDDDGYEPEAVPGEHPAIGFRLTEWGDVGRGHHWFAAIATVLPAAYDLDQFRRRDAEPLQIEVRRLAPAPQ